MFGEGVIQIGCGCCVVDFPPFFSSLQFPSAFKLVCSRLVLMIFERPLLRSLEDALSSLTDMRFAERAPARVDATPRLPSHSPLAISVQPYGRKLNPLCKYNEASRRLTFEALPVCSNTVSV